MSLSRILHPGYFCLMKELMALRGGTFLCMEETFTSFLSNFKLPAYESVNDSAMPIKAAVIKWFVLIIIGLYRVSAKIWIYSIERVFVNIINIICLTLCGFVGA